MMSAAPTAALSTDAALQMMAECFMAEPGSLRPDTLRESLPGWDSMGALALMAELDERFGLELSADDSRRMQTIADVLQFLRMHGVLSTS